MPAPLTPTEVGRLRSDDFSPLAIERMTAILQLLGLDAERRFSISQIANEIDENDPESIDWPLTMLCALGLVSQDSPDVFRSARSSVPIGCGTTFLTETGKDARVESVKGEWARIAVRVGKGRIARSLKKVSEIQRCKVTG